MKLKDIIAASFISSVWTLLALVSVLYGASRADGCEQPIDPVCILLGNINPVDDLLPTESLKSLVPADPQVLQTDSLPLPNPSLLP